mgnify:CR=1 FL=1
MATINDITNKVNGLRSHQVNSIYDMLVDFMTNNDIDEKRNISVKTVEAQTTIAIKKLTSFVNSHWNNSSLILFNLLLRKKN